MPEWPWFLSLYIVLSLSVATGLWVHNWCVGKGKR